MKRFFIKKRASSPLKLSLGLVLVTTGLFAIYYFSENLSIKANTPVFNPANIMTDAVMSDSNSMTVAEIQRFLDSKNPCNNTNTHMASWYPHLKYNIKDGKFVCMAKESFNGQSAAQIIWEAARDYRINPQVLIVLLQKEQGLVTDTWPNHVQYRTATGFGCPDTAACDSQYFGLKNQVRLAANLFRTVLDGGWTNYPVGRTYVQYHPNKACGGTYVNIQNRATSALYRYTPYQPNQAALSAGYGGGDSCSAYGNRNFFNYFRDWFGSSQGSVVMTEGVLVQNIDGSPVQGELLVGKKYRASFSIFNTSNSDYYLGYNGVSVALLEADGRRTVVDNVAWNDKTVVRAKSGYKYDKEFIPTKVGRWSLTFMTSSDDRRSWPGAYPPVDKPEVNRSIELRARPSKSLTSGVKVYNQDGTLVTGDLLAGRRYKVGFKITNNSELAYNLDYNGVSVRHNNAVIDNVSWDRNVVIQPNTTYTYLKDFTPDKPGSWRLVANRQDPTTGAWGLGSEIAVTAGENTAYTVTAGLSKSLTSGVKVYNQDGTLVTGDLLAGRRYKVGFKITNNSELAYNLDYNGVSVRHNNAVIDNVSWDRNVVIQPNTTYTYLKDFTPDKPGSWRLVANRQDPTTGAWGLGSEIAVTAGENTAYTVRAR